MGRLCYAWELGAGLGHVGPFMPLASALRDRGHDVHWAVTRPSDVAGLLAQAGFGCVSAPVPVESPGLAPPLSYGDILLRFGYGDAPTLLERVHRWRDIFSATGAHLVVADHAPTAVLAARTLGLPVFMFSTGFSAPPARHPLPNMRPWSPVSMSILTAIDEQARAGVNAVLAHCGCAPIARLAELFSVAETALVTYPELDHYPDRGPFAYWGALPEMGGGRSIQWRDSSRPRWFVYLRRQIPGHLAVLDALEAIGDSAAVFFPDAPDLLVARFAPTSIQIYREPLDLAQMVQDVDAAVSYASVQTTTRFLLAGKPLLLLPSHLERFMLAMRVAEMGAGRLVHPEHPAPNFRSLLTELMQSEGYRANAQAFAHKYRAFDQHRVLANLTRRIESLLDDG